MFSRDIHFNHTTSIYTTSRIVSFFTGTIHYNIQKHTFIYKTSNFGHFRLIPKISCVPQVYSCGGKVYCLIVHRDFFLSQRVNLVLKRKSQVLLFLFRISMWIQHQIFLPVKNLQYCSPKPWVRLEIWRLGRKTLCVYVLNGKRITTLDKFW